MNDPQLPPERVLLRLEHLMSEITHHPLNRDDGTSVFDRPQLLGPASPVVRHPRRRVAVLAGVAATVLLGTAAATLVSASSPNLGTPAFAVTTAEGGRSISIINTAAAAEQMTAQLAAEGLNITVQTAPVSSQLVGTWLGVGSDGTTDDATYDDVTAQALGYTDDITVPRDVTGLTLTVGIPAGAEEEPTVSGMRNAFAPGGPLECSSARGATLASATEMLIEQGYRTQVVTFATLEPALADDTDLVTTVFYDDDKPRELMLIATDPADATLQARLSLGFSPRQVANPDCP